MREALILGGYGNFGKRVAAALARHGVAIVIAGRNREKAEACATGLGKAVSGANIRAVRLDAERDLDGYLRTTPPVVVVNTCGPFQSKDYTVAASCIRSSVHYIDLADGRGFVVGITALDEIAKAAGVSVISGASTVPGLSSAVLDHYRHEFATIGTMRFGISPGQKAERGLATTEAILGYVGKRLRPVSGDPRPRYGWQDVYRQPYPGLGNRWMANCDVPDLDLLPPIYGIRRIRFGAGMESKLVHFGLYALSWLVRAKIPLDLVRHAETLLRASAWFDAFGTDEGGMHVILHGTDRGGALLVRSWFVVAKNGDGPQIPCVPAILLAKRLVQNDDLASGARACIGLVTLDDYKTELAAFAVTFYEQ